MKDISLWIRVLLCLLPAGVMLFSYIEKRNSLTELSLRIPEMEKEVRRIDVENIRLKYEIACFESPESLFSLAKDPRFSHLRFPFEDEVVVIQRGDQGEKRK